MRVSGGRTTWKDVTDVAQWRMCLGCGACVYACTEKKVQLVDLVDQGLRPVLTGQDCGSCSDCVDACPGVGISHEDRQDADGLIDSLAGSWGPVLEVWEGHAADPALRFGGSSGGLASALALYCIEQRGMRGLAHIGSDAKERYRNKSVFSTTKEQILAATG